MIGPMALWHYGIPIEPSIHESIESIHLDLLLLNLTYDLDQCLMINESNVLCPMSYVLCRTFWVLAWTLAPLSLSLPRPDSTAAILSPLMQFSMGVLHINGS